MAFVFRQDGGLFVPSMLITPATTYDEIVDGVKRFGFANLKPYHVFSIGDTALGDRRIESKDLFKMLTTRPIQVHQPFTIEMYAFDTTVTAHTDATVTAARNQLRPLKDINTGSIPKDIFLTLSFEYDEYDTAPRTH